MRRERTARWTAAACLAAATSLAAEPSPAPSDQALLEFLVRAKLEGYASGDPTRVRLLPDGGKEVQSEAAGFRYRDRWYGERRFSGEEIVWRDGREAWSMNFYGITTADAPQGFPEFHKRALRRAPAGSPFRGPALFREGDFVYLNTHRGSLAEFEGVERVFYRDQEIFRLSYHGGTLQD